MCLERIRGEILRIRNFLDQELTKTPINGLTRAIGLWRGDIRRGMVLLMWVLVNTLLSIKFCLMSRIMEGMVLVVLRGLPTNTIISLVLILIKTKWAPPIRRRRGWFLGRRRGREARRRICLVLVLTNLMINFLKESTKIKELLCTLEIKKWEGIAFLVQASTTWIKKYLRILIPILSLRILIIQRLEQRKDFSRRGILSQWVPDSTIWKNLLVIKLPRVRELNLEKEIDFLWRKMINWDPECTTFNLALTWFLIMWKLWWIMNLKLILDNWFWKILNFLI